MTARHAQISRPGKLYVGYIRVSTKAQGKSQGGLKAQRRAIEFGAKARGIQVAEVLEDIQSAKTMDRPAFQAALAMVRQGLVAGIICAKLDRATRTVVDFEGLITEAERDGWDMVLLDIGVDLKTASNRMIARNMANYAQYEREIISERTKAALAEKRAMGVRLGRPRQIPKQILQLVVTEFHACGSYEGVARLLNAHEVPTAQGGRLWYRAAVAKMIRSQDAQTYLAKQLRKARKAAQPA